MTQDFLKTIIQEEINRTIHENSLYIFDFDDTLVEDQASIYLVRSDGQKQVITPSDFHNIDLKDGESVDVTEFDAVTDPVIHDELMDILAAHQYQSVILTARNEAEPIRKFLATIGINIDVFAVGVKDPTREAIHINAQRKREWIEKAIKERDLEYVEFWDDNVFNIKEAESLRKKYPDVEIVTHLVQHK
jgi:hypothetical protein